MTPLETPYEGGLGFCVSLDKTDFIGKDALVKAKQDGLKRKLCTMVLDGNEFTQIYGGEAVYCDGKVIGRVRSGGFGYTLQKNILYAYLPIDLAKAGERLEIDLIEGRRQAEVTATVLFDPKGEKTSSLSAKPQRHGAVLQFLALCLCDNSYRQPKEHRLCYR